LPALLFHQKRWRHRVQRRRRHQHRHRHPPGEDRRNNNSAAENVDALNINTTGQYITAHGWHALSANTTGSDNTANGSYALFSNTTGSYNNALGDSALGYNTTGSFNVAVGTTALGHNASGWSNIAVGGDALSANATGMENTAMGDVALESNTTGSGNVAVGSAALASRTGASYQLQGANTAVGYRALSYTGAEWGTGSGGDGNTAVGDRAMLYNVDGSFNCAFGLLALSADNGETDSMENSAIGDRAGYGLRTGIGNVYIGEHEMARDPGENYHTYIHNINTTSVSGGFADTVTIDLNTGLLVISLPRDVTKKTSRGWIMPVTRFISSNLLRIVTRKRSTATRFSTMA